MQVCASLVLMDKLPNLKDAYGAANDEDIDALYRDWAHSYDAGFGDAQGYMLPREVAMAFVGAGGSGDVLDVGAGTGLVAEQLIGMGVSVIDGVDISAPMLSVARTKAIYRDLYTGNINAPLHLPVYQGVVSAGTFTLGHVGPEAISNLLDVAATGAIFVISVNAAHYESAGFAAYMDRAADQIQGLILTDVRIYDDRADAPHRDDIARLMVFRKA